MMASFRSWLGRNSAILGNTGSLMATTAATSVLGFAYWWLAARMFVPAAVGLASAAISMMMLLGIVGMFGLGTLLISELPRRTEQAHALIVTSLVAAGAASAVLGWLFAGLAPHVSPELAILARDPASTILFTAGVVLTAVTLVLDQAAIGLLRGQLQLGRNLVFTMGKLGLLYVAAVAVDHPSGMTIYATWFWGNALSLLAVAGIVRWRGGGARAGPDWRLLRRLRHEAWRHHLLNLALQSPGFVFPVLVTVLMSASVNASFYAAFMLVSFVYMVPTHLATVLHAVGSSAPTALASRLRLTLLLSLAIGTVAAATLVLAGPFLLGLFGRVYADEAVVPLRILSLGVFPLIVKVHYVAVSRVLGRLREAAGWMAIGGLLEIGLAVAGAQLWHLSGFCLGIVAGLVLQAGFVGPVVLRALANRPGRSAPT
jgi:O-antigen/teichoic acid export membrane protein